MTRLNFVIEFNGLKIVQLTLFGEIVHMNGLKLNYTPELNEKNSKLALVRIDPSYF